MGEKKKVLVALSIVILLIIIALAAYWFGKSKVPSQTPTPSPTPEATQTPAGSPTATPKKTVTPTPKPTPTKTPTPTPNIQTKTINSTATLDGWRASNGGGNTTWYVQIGHNETLTERGYVSFDLSSIPSGVTIVEAKLRMYQGAVVGTPYSGNSLIVDHVDYGGSLGSEDYAVTPLASAIGTLTSNTSVEWKDLTVTDQVKGDIAAIRVRSQFRLRLSSEFTGPEAWARFESGDNYLGTGNLPQLVVKYY